MPVHPIHAIKAGTTSVTLLIRASEIGDRCTPKTGLGQATAGASAACIREGEGHARSLPLVAGSMDDLRSGGFVEADPNLLPGVYAFGVPDEVLAAGSPRALLLLRFAGADIDPIEIDLVAFDPQDGDTVGIGQLGNAMRHRFLRRAMPNVTEEDLDAGSDLQQQLTARFRRAGGRDAEEA